MNKKQRIFFGISFLAFVFSYFYYKEFRIETCLYVSTLLLFLITHKIYEK